MAVLSDTDRLRTLAHFMRQQFGTIAISKAQLAAAVNAIDDFLETSATAINNAFPAAAKAGLTVSQKAIVVGYVANRRAGLLIAAEDQ